MIERIEGVEQRREIELWGRSFAAWGGDRIARIAGEFEKPLFNLAIALRDILGALVT